MIPTGVAASTRSSCAASPAVVAPAREASGVFIRASNRPGNSIPSLKRHCSAVGGGDAICTHVARVSGRDCPNAILVRLYQGLCVDIIAWNERQRWSKRVEVSDDVRCSVRSLSSFSEVIVFGTIG